MLSILHIVLLLTLIVIHSTCAITGNTKSRSTSSRSSSSSSSRVSSSTTTSSDSKLVPQSISYALEYTAVANGDDAESWNRFATFVMYFPSALGKQGHDIAEAKLSVHSRNIPKDPLEGAAKAQGWYRVRVLPEDQKIADELYKSFYPTTAAKICDLIAGGKLHEKLTVYTDASGHIHTISFNPEVITGHASAACLSRVKSSEIPVVTDVVVGFGKIGSKMLKIDPPQDTQQQNRPEGIFGLLQTYWYVPLILIAVLMFL